jgi:hypothetical protein
MVSIDLFEEVDHAANCRLFLFSGGQKRSGLDG